MIDWSQLFTAKTATITVGVVGVLWLVVKLLHRRLYRTTYQVTNVKTNKPIPTVNFWVELWTALKVFMLKLYRQWDGIGDTLAKGRKYGKTFLSWQGTTPIVIISQPEDLKVWIDDKVFKKDEAFLKGNFPMQQIFGTAVVGKVGHTWERQRLALKPSFGHSSMSNFVGYFARAATELAQQWEGQWKKEKDPHGILTLPTYDDISKMTINAVGMTGFGTDFAKLREDCEIMMQGYKTASKALFRPFVKPWMLNLPFPYFVKLKKAYQQMNDKFYYLFDNSTSPSPNLLSHLASTTKDKITLTELQDNLFIFLIAGHDTCSSSLTSCLYFMALYPDVQKRVFKEIFDQIGSDVTDYEKFKKIKLEYTKMVVKEVIRMHPPVDRTNYRTCLKDGVELGGYRIPKGTNVMPLIPLTNFDHDLWEDPFTFNPERWRGEKNMTTIGSWMTFSTGPRTCLGKKFSLLYVPMALATLVLHFKFSLLPDYKWKTRPIAMCLRPVDNLPIQLKKRTAKKE